MTEIRIGYGSDIKTLKFSKVVFNNILTTLDSPEIDEEKKDEEEEEEEEGEDDEEGVYTALRILSTMRSPYFSSSLVTITNITG